MINARATAKVLDTIQAWLTEMSPTSSQLGRDTALRTLLDRLRGQGEGNGSYEDTIVNMAKLLEIRMTPNAVAPVVKPADVIVRRPGERIRCTAVQNIWAESGELSKLQCGRDVGHQGLHSTSYTWRDKAAESEAEAAA